MSRPLDRDGDAGSAVVEVVAVLALATLVLLGLIQVTLALHVRNTLVDCASEGARYGGLADRQPADGAARTRELLTLSLGAGYAGDVTARHSVRAGVPVVQVTVRAPVPAVGLWGPGQVTVRGHGMVE